jgi:hypothetical protein
VVSFRHQLLYPQGKSPWYPLDRRMGGPQSQSGHTGEEKYSQILLAFKPPIIQPIAQCYTTELSLIPFIDSMESNLVMMSKFSVTHQIIFSN